MKNFSYAIMFVLCAATGSYYAFAMNTASSPKSYNWHYKITVTIETPDGDISGSAVHEISNGAPNSFNPEVGNPGKVRGEAVVVDMTKRGVLFALISHESDNRFYDVFPLPGQNDGQGGSTLKGFYYHASLPIGTKGIIDPTEWPGYPKLVTFTDMNDPKSVTLAQEWERGKDGRLSLKNDHMEELFGVGVKLKSIELEITDEPTTWGVVDQYLPEKILTGFQEWWKSISNSEKMEISEYLQFKQGN